MLDTATVTIAVPAPTATATDDSFATLVDVSLSDTVATNDTPCSSGTTSYQLNSLPASTNGTVSAFAGLSGAFTYDPNAGFSGTDQFGYDILCDGNIIDSAIVDIVISAITADAVNDSETGIYNIAFNGDVTGNDTPCSGGTQTHSLVAASEVGGTVVVNTAGTYIFTPSTNFTGDASFQNKIECNGTVIDTATVTINYPAPTADAVNDNFNTLIDTVLSDDVAANDTPCTFGATTTYQQSGGGTSNGTVTVFNTDGTFTYNPNGGFSGADSFDYEILCDGVVTDAATVNITITAITATAVDDTFTGLYNLPFSGDVTTNDTPCSAGVQTHAVVAASEIGGTVTAFDTNAGTFTFTPSANFTGAGSFQYQILCNGAVIDTALATINYPAPTATAVDDGFTTILNQALSDSVVANDTPCSLGATTTYASNATAPSNGTLDSFSTGGAFTYTPNTAFTGTDTFGYDLI